PPRDESLGAETAERELDRGCLRSRDLVLAIRQLPEHPAGEHLFEPPVHDPAREARVDLAPERTRCLTFLDDALEDLERLTYILDLPLELLAPGDLPDHDGHEGGIVAPGPKQDLRDSLDLLLSRLIGCLDGAEASDELSPVLDEDRSQDVVLRREVVVEKPVRDAGVRGDVRHAR